MTFSFPQSREDFMLLVQQVAKEDVKRCLAGIPVTHPHLAKLMMAPHDSNCISETKEEEEQFFHDYRNHQQLLNDNNQIRSMNHETGTLPTSDNNVTITKSIINNNTIQDAVAESSKQQQPSTNANRPSQTVSTRKLPEKPKEIRKPLVERQTNNFKPQQTNNSSVPASPKNISPKQTSPSSNGRNEVYERLLKPTVSTQKKFEKETKPQKKEEKEFRELRKEQKKATSLLLRKKPSPKKLSPKTSPKKNVSFSEALSQVQYKDGFEHDKENINNESLELSQQGEEKLNKVNPSNMPPSPPSTPSNTSTNPPSPKSVIQARPHTTANKTPILETPCSLERTKIETDQFSKTNEVTQASPVQIVKTQVEIGQNCKATDHANAIQATSQKATQEKNNFNYEHLEEMLLNDLLLEIAKEEQSNRKEMKRQHFNLMQGKARQNRQFDEMLNLLKEMEQQEHSIRRRYQNKTYLDSSSEISSVTSSVDSSSTATTDSTLSRGALLDEHIKSKIRKARQKQKHYFDTYCKPYDITVDTLMQV
ncbi:hypothetical protein C9374_001864 [Naegleria lovaniensis]|uniref:Uncharacterized protein n=1 Tax=Naegleria lovaniensis TaxID=51637 RepID=A0AA88KMC6_NAELO|nr:uncharacterized protein C9374_001864 [Naegleria lovaniensis]KAG2386829.1 hypothetical protein C9374_001864 [Naegleria lovaniensis]